MKGGAVFQWILVAALLPGLWRLDRWLSQDASGPERHAVRGGLARTEAKPEAQSLVILGSSTSRDWITFKRLSRFLGEEQANVLDAHINGCHQGCSWAQVRRLLKEGRHFRVALYGVNQFQFCDEGHSKRVLQHRMLVPPADIPALFGHYLTAEEPLRKVGQFLLGALSTAYADPRFVRTRFRRGLFGRERPRRANGWAKEVGPDPPRRVACSYEDDAVAFKEGLTVDLLDDVVTLADDVYLLMLPDATLAASNTDVKLAWRRHREFLEDVASTRPSVTLVDLTATGPWTAGMFKDGAHLQRSVFPAQFRALLEALEPSRRAAP